MSTIAATTPAKSPYTPDETQVYQLELESIRERRTAAGIASTAESGDGTKPDLLRHRVGLALSGGGIRSATFNLGILQSLYKTGILRQIDYLSTVSGGGYVGCFLSSLAKRPDVKFKWEAGDSSVREPDVLEPSADHRQSAMIQRLILGGKVLNKPLLWLNSHLWGLVLVNLSLVSGLVLVLTTFAWGYRALDGQKTMRFLEALGFDGDVSRALVPSIVLFVVWVACMFVEWAIARIRDRRRGVLAKNLCRTRHMGRVSAGVLFALLASLLMAAAVVLSTGDISLSNIKTSWNLPLPDPKKVDAISADVKTWVFIVILVGLLPYFRLNDLIRSGTRPRSTVEGWIFRIASYALLVGGPMILFSVVVQENISRSNDTRPKRYELDIRHLGDDPESFWSRINQEALALQKSASAKPASEKSTSANVADGAAVTPQPGGDQSPDQSGVFQVSKKIWESANRVMVDDTTTKLLADWDKKHKVLDSLAGTGNALAIHRKSLREQKPWSVVRWYSFLKGLVTSNQEFDDDLERTVALENLTDSIFAQVNKDIVSENSFYEAFATVGEDSPSWIAPENRNQIIANRERARAYHDAVKDSDVEVQRINRELLQLYYGDMLRPWDTVFAYFVQGADQETRWEVLRIAIAVCLFFGCLVSLNRTSLHSYYRDRLTELWLDPSQTEHGDLPLRELATTRRGLPYQLINATVNFLGKGHEGNSFQMADFLFSQRYCGSSELGFRRTELYEEGHYSVNDAMAVSGAAMTPTVTGNPLAVVVMFVLNLRLGQWLPNPKVERSKWDYRPSPLFGLLNAVFVPPIRRRRLLVTDGGHYENTAVEALLRRRCRIIIACDASQDGDYEFRDFVRLIRRSHVEMGIELVSLTDDTKTVSLGGVAPNAISGFARSHWIVAKILYPATSWSRVPGPEGETGDDVPQFDCPREGFLIYVKPNFTGDEPVEMLGFRREVPVFPHDPTLDQFYDPAKFESYRSLGWHIGTTLCDQLLNGYCDCTPGLRTPGRSSELLAEWDPRTPALPAGAVIPPPTAVSDLSVLSERPFHGGLAGRMFALLRDPSASVRHLACCYLHEWGTDDEQPFDPLLRKQTIEELLKCLRTESDPDVRIEICKCLSWIGEDDPEVIAEIEARANDPAEDRLVRSACQLFS